MLSKLNSLREKNEDGFTLIELLIVVVIIGILAAIAIPIFLNQQKAAIAGTVKSDVRNTVTNVATYLTKNSSATTLPLNAAAVTGPPAVPAVTNGIDVVKTSNNVITIDGNWKAYYVLGVNPDLGTAATASATGTGSSLTAVADFTSSTTGNGYLFNSTTGKYTGAGAIS